MSNLEARCSSENKKEYFIGQQESNYFTKILLNVGPFRGLDITNICKARLNYPENIIYNKICLKITKHLLDSVEEIHVCCLKSRRETLHSNYSFIVEGARKVKNIVKYNAKYDDS